MVAVVVVRKALLVGCTKAATSVLAESVVTRSNLKRKDEAMVDLCRGTKLDNIFLVK